jgi:hypothetical protein
VDLAAIRRDGTCFINSKWKLPTRLFQICVGEFVKILVLIIEYVLPAYVSFCTTAAFSEGPFTAHSSTALRASKVTVIVSYSLAVDIEYGLDVEGNVRSSQVHTGSERFLHTVYCNP